MSNNPHSIGHVNRIGLIGDVHAEDELLAQALSFLTDASQTSAPIDALLCTGDVADGGGCVDRSCALLAEYGVHTVRGNHDRWLLADKVRHIPEAHERHSLNSHSQTFLDELPATIRFDTPMGPGLLCHGIAHHDQAKVWPGTERLKPESSELLDDLLALDEYRVLLNGHMHFRTVIHFESLALLNAGTLKPRHRPGFSIVDFTSGEILAYEFAEQQCQHVITRSLNPAADNRVWRDTQEFDGAWEPTTLYAPS
ncbi:MAG: metallophosphoesterase family protein [Pseudomonadales bacterium]